MKHKHWKCAKGHLNVNVLQTIVSKCFKTLLTNSLVRSPCSRPNPRTFETTLQPIQIWNIPIGFQTNPWPKWQTPNLMHWFFLHMGSCIEAWTTNLVLFVVMFVSLDCCIVAYCHMFVLYRLNGELWATLKKSVWATTSSKRQVHTPFMKDLLFYYICIVDYFSSMHDRCTTILLCRPV